MIQKIRRALLGGALTVAATPMMIALTASPAAAHYTYVYHGSDLATVSSDHNRTSLCDMENDGNPVMAYYIYSGGRMTSYTIATYLGCGTRSIPGISQFQLCEQGEGCTPWKRA